MNNLLFFNAEMRLNRFKPNRFFHPYYLEESIFHFRSVRLIFFSLVQHNLIFFLVNSEDPGETPHYAASNLGLLCLLYR